ncbi:hypothetical protein [Thermorudis peleae]|uniref:hypothetical protein n=1 Tax=Thermorudis peleae TaxID=1382356 RepID=UPI00056F385E|nr:hypothetical protein [Thermorudis peleae]
MGLPEVAPSQAEVDYLPTRRRRNPVLGLAAGLRWIVRNVLWVIIATIRLLWRHFTLILLFAIAAYLIFHNIIAPRLASPTQPSQPTVAMAPAIQPTEAVLRYLEGQRTFNAQEMWDAMSDTTKARSLAAGGSLSTFASAIEEARQSGIAYGDSIYIGGYQLNNGVRYYFYVTEVHNDAGRSVYVYQVFVVDPAGKILNVDTPQLQQS